MTAEQIKAAWDKTPDRLSHAFGAMLRDFGYPSVTDAWVKAELTSLYAGKPAKPGPSGFMAEWIKNGIEED